MMTSKEEEIKKIVPSKLEHALYKVVYNHISKLVPERMTPNQMTALGALFGLLGIICTFLSVISRFFLIGTIIGLILHIICDDLDGFIARKKNMSSDAGAYFDLITDILHITYLLIAMCFADIVSFQVAIFLVPVYGLLMFIAMNYIRFLNEFLFPRVGPIETHLLFIGVCLVSMIFGNEPYITVFEFGFKITDILFIVGGSIMYYEMIRLAIQLFKRLKKKEDNV